MDTTTRPARPRSPVGAEELVGLAALVADVGGDEHPAGVPRHHRVWLGHAEVPEPRLRRVCSSALSGPRNSSCNRFSAPVTARGSASLSRSAQMAASPTRPSRWLLGGGASRWTVRRAGALVSLGLNLSSRDVLGTLSTSPRSACCHITLSFVLRRRDAGPNDKPERAACTALGGVRAG